MCKFEYHPNIYTTWMEVEKDQAEDSNEYLDSRALEYKLYTYHSVRPIHHHRISFSFVLEIIHSC